jgi:mRNA interferase MazF
MNRGEIYWCDLNPRRGRGQGEKRPVVIVSVDAYNESRSALIGVVPMTTAGLKNPIHVPLSRAETGLAADSTALVDHARFLDRNRLLDGSPAGRLTAAAQQRVDRNLKRILGL